MILLRCKQFADTLFFWILFLHFLLPTVTKVPPAEMTDREIKVVAALQTGSIGDFSVSKDAMPSQ